MTPRELVLKAVRPLPENDGELEYLLEELECYRESLRAYMKSVPTTQAAQNHLERVKADASALHSSINGLPSHFMEFNDFGPSRMVRFKDELSLLLAWISEWEKAFGPRRKGAPIAYHRRICLMLSYRFLSWNGKKCGIRPDGPVISIAQAMWEWETRETGVAADAWKRLADRVRMENKAAGDPDPFPPRSPRGT